MPRVARIRTLVAKACGVLFSVAGGKKNVCPLCIKFTGTQLLHLKCPVLTLAFYSELTLEL